MRMPALLLTALLLVALADRRYDDYTVLRLYPRTERQLLLLSAIEKKASYDFWRPVSKLMTPVDVMLHPAEVVTFQSLLKIYNIQHSVMIADVQRLIDDQRLASLQRQSASASGSFWEDYQRYGAIMTFLDQLAANSTDGRVTAFSIGTSTEGRDLKALKISTGGDNRPAFWIDANVHAREWISNAVLTWIANQLATADDPETAELLNNFDLLLLPMVNPDGYEFTFTNDRMWRKTRSQTSVGFCTGTDANRNWDYHWAESGASGNPCSDTYEGSAAFSEPEVALQAEYMKSHGNIKAVISLHSYSQLILLPWGYTSTRIPNYDVMMEIGNAGAAAIKETSGKRYQVGATTEILYPASGGSFDWQLGVAGIPYPFGMELRDTGLHGFLLPPSQIVPCAQEVYAAVKAMASTIVNIENQK